MAQPKERSTGKIKWFDISRGYGFISVENLPNDIFVHKSDISASLHSLQTDDIVEFSIVKGKQNKAKAINVIPITNNMKIQSTLQTKPHIIYAKSGMETNWQNILNEAKQSEALQFIFSCKCMNNNQFGDHLSLSKLLKIMADSVGNKIHSFKIGDDECGFPANYLKSNQWSYIFAKCTNLINITLESTYNADDDVFDSIIKHCPKIEQLTITGNDKISGSLTNKSILKLVNNENCLSKLTKLGITDQWDIDLSLIQILNKKRASIKVIGGETDGYSMASMMVMAQMGSGWNQGLYGNDEQLQSLQNQNVPAPSDLFDFSFGHLDDDDDDDFITFLRPDGDYEQKTVAWCKDNGFFQVKPGYWSGSWYESKRHCYEI